MRREFKEKKGEKYLVTWDKAVPDIHESEIRTVLPYCGNVRVWLPFFDMLSPPTIEAKPLSPVTSYVSVEQLTADIEAVQKAKEFHWDRAIARFTLAKRVAIHMRFHTEEDVRKLCYKGIRKLIQACDKMTKDEPHVSEPEWREFFRCEVAKRANQYLL